ncbi:hypothetical protein TNIN_119481 [Trichonephila inaurata madagascariensis]|uniref:Uncharacterized protein n=1 Tax=Trichonephila inaurata madagascariensis TaxID=2747483 RepID=A0A8X6YPP2_9ARAC|nr:hypothetical protein TNIN_119481 [Trichonephila inaurata madagascariensis]
MEFCGKKNINDHKEKLNSVNGELTMMISCFEETWNFRFSAEQFLTSTIFSGTTILATSGLEVIVTNLLPSLSNLGATKDPLCGGVDQHLLEIGRHQH